MNSVLFGLVTATALLAIADAIRQRADNRRLRKRLEDWQDRAIMIKEDRYARLGEAMARDYHEQND